MKKFKVWQIAYTPSRSPYQFDEAVIGEPVRRTSENISLIACEELYPARQQGEKIATTHASILALIATRSDIRAVVCVDSKKRGFAYAPNTSAANQALDFILLKNAPLAGMIKVAIAEEVQNA